MAKDSEHLNFFLFHDGSIRFILPDGRIMIIDKPEGGMEPPKDWIPCLPPPVNPEND